MVYVKDIAQLLETWAPLAFQASYDNSGLLVGDPSMLVTGVLVALDVTEEVLQEAKDKGCNLLVTHHPIIFKGLKQLTGKTEVERCVAMALRDGIALYAAHTNLDSVEDGVSHALAEALSVHDLSILAPREGLLYGLNVHTPLTHTEKVANALFDAGAGRVGRYDACHFNVQGEGTFRPLSGANPFDGVIGEQKKVQEAQQHFVVSAEHRGAVQTALVSSHPYEVVAHSWIAMENTRQDVGFGVIGALVEEMDWKDFVQLVKNTLGVSAIRHSPLVKSKVKKIALCGGAGMDLLPQAIRQNADVYLTADITYHRYFEAKGALVLMDVGHWESEQFTIKILADHIQRKFRNFAVLTTTSVTNPMITV
ncbi:MAG: hypothetical protein ABR98_08085 [Cryomorphaceae bacterium BACL7 MAG-120910-bin2]|jgi:dinuclear metal center YbgI/SA1388 family protein|nr:MAG: hypothetical protein ABR98_08085 [Cryomorphaceae bacterium BACL7 MAG-120910-bin2]KRO69457.1 MAG: hypothetical protein ABR88_05645 [Cryomorphaceae bacterium BACL7 MAG-120322-bin74]KRO82715.1 MAG: hypothetical protein ABR87_07460 [Cryomorphaceae bacterium BACL7 MAG-121220-bin83]NQW25108.1 Nif3-like dinuclear metal center hexameric protein [Cryomorphaceae bacterium]